MTHNQSMADEPDLCSISCFVRKKGKPWNPHGHHSTSNNIFAYCLKRGPSEPDVQIPEILYYKPYQGHNRSYNKNRIRNEVLPQKELGDEVCSSDWSRQVLHKTNSTDTLANKSNNSLSYDEPSSQTTYRWANESTSSFIYKNCFGTGFTSAAPSPSFIDLKSIFATLHSP